MKIYTLWHQPNRDLEMPCLIDALDEYTLDENGGYPESYAERHADTAVRELIIDIPEKSVQALFKVPLVRADVITE